MKKMADSATENMREKNQGDDVLKKGAKMVRTAETESGQRCLVTGGCGFIGSHLCEYLLGRGYQVICMDSLLTGSVRGLFPRGVPRRLLWCCVRR